MKTYSTFFSLPRALTLFFGMFVLAASHATTYQQMDLSEMTEVATDIVAVEVVSNRSERTNSGSRTLVEVRVMDSMKGQAADLITVELPGGSFKIGRLRVGEVNAGAPQMFVNQKALLFLDKPIQSSFYSLVGFSQGYMPLQESSSGSVLQNLMTGGKAMSLKAMKQQIMQVQSKALSDAEPSAAEPNKLSEEK